MLPLPIHIEDLGWARIQEEAEPVEETNAQTLPCMTRTVIPN